VNVAVAPNPSAGVFIYPSTDCSGAPDASLTIAQTLSATSFSFTSGTPGALTLTASAATLQSATQTEVVDPPNAPSLAISAPVAVWSAATCAGPFQVVSLTSDGGLLPVDAGGVTVSLTVSPSGPQFFSPGCSGSGMSSLTVVIPAGRVDAGFSLDGCPRGSYQLTAHDVSSTYTDGNASVYLDAGPTALRYDSLPQMVTAGFCSSGVTFEVDDVCGNPINAGSTPVSLASLPAGLEFFQDNACASPVSTVVAASGIFYFEAQDAGFYDAGISQGSWRPDVQQEQVLACVGLQMGCLGQASCCMGSTCDLINGTCCRSLLGSCTLPGDCCHGVGSPPACDGGSCCIANQGLCSNGPAYCCDGACAQGLCCKPDGVACQSNAECCGQACDIGQGVCDAGTGSCQPLNTACVDAGQCCTGGCAGRCCYPAMTIVAATDCSDCCVGTCGAQAICPDGGSQCALCK
jgi:hypothetical protein